MAYKAFFDEVRTFGVEIETFGVPRRKILTTLKEAGIACVEVNQTNEVLEVWRLSDDGSIKGSMTTEVVSPPLCGQEGLDQLRLVMDTLQDLGCQVNASCGFHVHWNCGDFTGKNVLSLLRLYAKFEEVIDYFVAASRRGNSNEHCLSLRKDDDLTWIRELDPNERNRAAQLAIDFERKYAVQRYLYHTHRSSRYHKVNITAYNLYGTVEFRQHQGTLNGDKAVNWVVFTQQLVNKAKNVSVSRDPSAKPTLGELLRTLKVVDHKFIENQCTDLRVLNLAKYLKRRYREFRQEEERGTELVEYVADGQIRPHG